MIYPRVNKILLFTLLVSCIHAYANDKIIAGTISCSAEWNELCEDKKIISVPEHYRLCQHLITTAEKSGDTSHQVVASDEKSITVYFRAKGNQDRFKPMGASIKLNIDLIGVKETESCEEFSSAVTQAQPTAPEPEPAPLNDVKIPAETPVPAPTSTEAVATQENPHACACSQWLNWMKVEHCLAKEQRPDRPPCDSYQVTIQCVSSKDECRSIQKDNCPQVVGLNQSTSLKRLFIENSHYCQK